MVFEGIVISRIPYKERDLIAKILLRNGHLASFYVYGGMGGGKHHKASLFEHGSMMKINIKEAKNHRVDGSDLMVVSEYQRLWEPTQLRHNVQAFYLSCLYFEILQKIAIPFKLGLTEDNSHEGHGIFPVMSNALFQMEDALVKDKFLPEQQLSLFLIKLIFHLGIMPDTDSCSTCGSDLMEGPGASFLPANGQFACLQCVTAENEKSFLLRIKKGFQTKYSEYDSLVGSTFQESDKLIQYFCHQFHLRPVELKSYKLLFK
jgi:recombinational DNA repair protein (RecF pathway)